MLTRMIIRNFKKLKDADIELGESVVLIGPNNSGKTTALQALALWDIGLRRWQAKRSGKASPEKRPGVTINRKDLISIPVPNADLLWNDLRHRARSAKNGGQAPQTKNVRIDIVVEGIVNGKAWSCGLEFDYINDESFVCRPIRQDGFEDKRVEDARFTTIPEIIGEVKIAYLPPMSGLAANEPKWELGKINVLLGEGQTAQVLRNLCYQISSNESTSDWQELCETIRRLFMVKLNPPEYVAERGEITMTYEEPSGVRLDLSCSGRGLQQTLLLLAYLYANPRTVLLLDEPDAHLEILRQREIYDLISTVAGKQGSQVIAASHSEVVLNEAVAKGVVVAFVGKPHRLDGPASQVGKALKDIGFDQYYQAEQKGWCLYLEGATDLTILKTFARLLNHESAEILETAFVHYVANQPPKAREHFFGLKEAYPELAGLAIFDRLDRGLQSQSPLCEIMWKKREIENYLCMEEVLMAYAKHDIPEDDLFGAAESQKRETVMRDCIREVSKALETLELPGPWSDDIKASDDFLDRLFTRFFKELGLRNLLGKTNYHELAALVPAERIDPEVRAKLDVIVETSRKAHARQ